MTKRLKLLVLDDYEGELSAAPAMSALRELADVHILRCPLEQARPSVRAGVQAIFALRERTRIDAALLDQFPDLELILQSGGHAYHLDQAAAKERGVTVLLGRGAKRPMVLIPELTFALILGLHRQLYRAQQEMKLGNWPEMMGQSLHGRTMGILGYGRHGKPIGRIARAFGMNVIAWDRGGDYASDEPDVERVPIEHVMAFSDVVSVHLRLSDESRGLISRELLGRMKSTAYFINTARGAIVDEVALTELLQQKLIAGAGLDVFAHEPLPQTSPLRKLDNVLLTPHIGWKAAELLHEWVEIAVGQLNGYLEMDGPSNGPSNG